MYDLITTHQRHTGRDRKLLWHDIGLMPNVILFSDAPCMEMMGR